MSSAHVGIDPDSEYDRLMAAMDELRARGPAVVGHARPGRAARVDRAASEARRRPPERLTQKLT
jgi:hypothetical protein